jgi:hypothetical protein
MLAHIWLTKCAWTRARMGDLLGSPCLVSLFLEGKEINLGVVYEALMFFFNLSSQIHGWKFHILMLLGLLRCDGPQVRIQTYAIFLVHT